MDNRNWYGAAGWYPPAESAEKVNVTAPAGEKKKKKKSHALWWILGSVALLLALIVGTSIFFRDMSVTSYSAQIPNESQNSGGDSSGDNGGSSGRNWRDYLDNFYQVETSESAKVNIKRTETPIAFKLVLRSPLDEELGLSEIYEENTPSIVAISGYVTGKNGYNWGTGVVLSSDGLILTNTHVIDGCDSATVTMYDDTVYEATLVGADTISDLAVLKVDASDLVPAAFGDSSLLSVGDSVAAIGNPLGSTFRFTLTNGIISAIERGISYNGHSMNLLQTNTAINEGNSGGPLFNMYGQVIGITNMKMMSSYSSIEGIGFAIPSATVVNVVNALVKDGEVRGRTSIGITVGAIPSDTPELEGIPEGLYISAVTKGSDAEAKGLQAGDIIVAVNGQLITTTSELSDLKDSMSVGDTLTFTIWRDGETFSVDVMLMDTIDVYGG